jgi:hypothetical protein
MQRANRSARTFLVFPMVIGAVQFVFSLFDEATFGDVPSLIVKFVLAVSGFHLTLCIASLIGEIAMGRGGALATEVICPARKHPQHITVLCCLKCRAHIGVPETSSRTYLYCSIAFAVFQCLWMVRSGRYFFGVS